MAEPALKLLLGGLAGLGAEAFQRPAARKQPRPEGSGLPDLFRLTDRAVEFYEEKGEEGGHWLFVCSRLEVVAETRDGDGKAWGRLLLVTDRDGRQHEWAMPMSLLAADGVDYRKMLLDLGLIIAPGRSARERLHSYISTARPQGRARCVSRVGWHTTTGGPVFVLPDSSFGDTNGERVLLQTAAPGGHAYAASGTLDDWRREVAASCIGNSRLVLAVSAAFAATMLEVGSEESGGLHFVGQSRSGKSTALRVAGSVWGGGGVNGFIRQWRGTANGLEAIAEAHCDCLLCLDEMGQVDGREAGEIAYMLANGSGKSRARVDGSSRRASSWRVLFLSTGEISLVEKMQEIGQKAKAGQEVRLVDIPADADAGMGMFERLHGEASPEAFARRLRDASARFYGTAITAFLDAFTTRIGRDKLLDRLSSLRHAFISTHVPAGASGQVLSVAGRFALIAAGGELATHFGVTGWQKDEAKNAAARCFAAWLERRGTSGSSEAERGIAQVRAFIEMHGAARFTPLDNDDSAPADERTVNRAGYRRRDSAGDWEYLVLPQVWTQEVCRGFDAKAVARELAARGLLVPGRDNRSSTTVRIRGADKPRVYHLLPGILGERGEA